MIDYYTPNKALLSYRSSYDAARYDITPCEFPFYFEIQDCELFCELSWPFTLIAGATSS